MDQIYRPIPFYMVYPLNHEEELEKDASYFISMYPSDAKLIQRYVEEALEFLEYEGSRIYDEFPDKFMLGRVAADVYRRAREIHDIEKKKDMIDVILYHELWRRRHRVARKIFKI